MIAEADLTLSCGDMFAALSLQGGGIEELRRGNQALMISAPTPPFLGSFAMVPFCSRITSGRFDYRGKSVQLAPNFPPEPHAIHGFGWQSRWQIARLEQNIFVLDQSVDLRTVIDIASYQPLIVKDLSKFSVTFVNSNGDDIVIINE